MCGARQKARPHTAWPGERKCFLFSGFALWGRSSRHQTEHLDFGLWTLRPKATQAPGRLKKNIIIIIIIVRFLRISLGVTVQIQSPNAWCKAKGQTPHSLTRGKKVFPFLWLCPLGEEFKTPNGALGLWTLRPKATRPLRRSLRIFVLLS